MATETETNGAGHGGHYLWAAGIVALAACSLLAACWFQLQWMLSSWSSGTRQGSDGSLAALWLVPMLALDCLAARMVARQRRDMAVAIMACVFATPFAAMAIFAAVTTGLSVMGVL
jgi:hypothetical protein